MRRKYLLWFGRLLAVVCLTATLHAHAPSIGLSSQLVSLATTPNGPSPVVKSVILSNTTHGRMFWTATATVDAEGKGNWLSVSPTQGILTDLLEQQELRISANATGLDVGVYSGKITISAPGDALNVPADNTPQVIPVFLTISATGQPAPAIGLAGSLSTVGIRSTGRVYTLTMQVSNLGGGTLNWTAAASTDSGGDWLSLSRSSGTGNGPVFVSASVGNLAAGTYTGKVTVSAAGAANTPQSLPVTFAVREPIPATLAVSSLQVGFAAVAEGAKPAPQSLFISNLGETPLNWTVAATTFTGGAWLTVSPGSGTDNGPLQLTADTTGMGLGTYQGQITITSPGAVNSPIRVPVRLDLSRPTPRFQAIGVVNAATYVSGPVAPGEILSIFGARLGPEQSAQAQFDPDTGKLPTTLGGVQVTFDGVPAPLYFVSFGQLNLQVPFEVGGKTSARLLVTVPDLDPAGLTVPVAEAAPGLFTTGLDGRRVLAVNQDNSINAADNPAAAGSVVVLYLTGQGMTNPKVPTGAPAPLVSPFPLPALPVAVTIDALPARVIFAGLAPGFVGLTQINAEVPRAVLPSSNVPVSVSLGPYQAAKVAMIAVQ